MKKLALISALLIFALIGCSSAPGESKIDLKFTFDDGPEGWTGDFTDLPADYNEELYELEFSHAELPEEVGPGAGLRLKGQNSSDDIFMFIKRQIGDLKPNTEYKVVVEIDLATDAPAGAMGIGGAPGEATFVKVGASDLEPVPVVEDGFITINVDKGSQNGGGEDAIQIGNSAKVVDEEFYVYEIKTMGNEDQPLIVKTDNDGKLWIFAGTDSGFEGLTILYYAEVRVALEAQ